MGKYYAIGDIHGRLDLLQSVLRDWKHDDEQLVFLGDYIDYGPYSRQTLNEIKFLTEKYGAIALKGNHEHVFSGLIQQPTQPPIDGRHWLDSGRRETVHSFLNDDVGQRSRDEALAAIQQQHAQLLQFMDDLPLHYETERFIFVHAGIDTLESDWRLTQPSDFMELRSPFIHGINHTGKLVVFGHSRTGWIRGLAQGQSKAEMFAMDILDDRVWLSPCESKLGIDGGCVFGGVLHGVHLDDERPDTVVTTVTQDGSRHKALLSLEGGLLKS